MIDSAHGADGYHRRKLFRIGVIALFPLMLLVIFGGLWIADRRAASR